MTTGSGTGTTVSSNSYGSVSEVMAFTRHLLDGETTYNSTTRPTSTEVQKFLDRASGVLNSALSTGGFAVPVTQNDVKLALDDWVVSRAAEMAELTQRGTGFSDEEGARTSGLKSLYTMASEFVKINALGWKWLGATVDHAISEGLDFTGIDAQVNRADPDDTSLEQPLFRRGLFDEPGGSGAYGSSEDDDG